MSPKKRTFRGQKCPRDVTPFVHEMSPTMSTKCLPPLLGDVNKLFVLGSKPGSLLKSFLLQVLTQQASVHSVYFMTKPIKQLLLFFYQLLQSSIMDRQSWIVNHYVKSQSNNLSNENINIGVSVVFKTKHELKCPNELFLKYHLSENTSIYGFISEIV